MFVFWLHLLRNKLYMILTTNMIHKLYLLSIGKKVDNLEWPWSQALFYVGTWGTINPQTSASPRRSVTRSTVWQTQSISIWVHKVTFCALKIRQNAFPAGAPPGPRYGSLRRSPEPLVGWEGDSLPIHRPTQFGGNPPNIFCRTSPA